MVEKISFKVAILIFQMRFPRTVRYVFFCIMQGFSLLLRCVKTFQESFKEARNSFVGRAQTGFQFSRETQKLKQTNKNGVALSSGFNILRRSFKSCV